MDEKGAAVVFQPEPESGGCHHGLWMAEETSVVVMLVVVLMVTAAWSSYFRSSSEVWSARAVTIASSTTECEPEAEVVKLAVTSGVYAGGVMTTTPSGYLVDGSMLVFVVNMGGMRVTTGSLRTVDIVAEAVTWKV